MFPTTRQSLVVATVLWSLLVGFCLPSGQLLFAPADQLGIATLCAQEEPEPEPAVDLTIVEEEPDVVAWKAPEWVLTPAQAEEFRKREMSKIITAFKNKNPSDADKLNFHKVVHYYLSKLTHPSNGNLPKDVVDRFHGQLTNSFTMPVPRDIMLQEVLDKIPVLLDHPRDITRYNAVLLLSSLSVEKASINPKAPAKPYVDAYKRLSEVVTNTNQLLECRILAARGLGRILRDADPSSNQRSDIGLALTNALASVPAGGEDAHWWFRFRLTESLGHVGRLDNTSVQNRGENVLDALTGVLRNSQEKLLTRCQAAQSISQLPLTASTDVPAILYDVNKLLADMCVAYEASYKKYLAAPQKNPMSPLWRMAFSRIYLSYRPASSKEAGKNWGFLYKGVTKYNASVTKAWEAAFPVVKDIVGHQDPMPIPAVALTGLQAWVNANQPPGK